MRQCRRIGALLLSLVMLLALAAGCGEQKSPSEAYFDLLDELAALENRDYSMQLSLESDGQTVTVSLDGQMYHLTESPQMVLGGSVNYSGVSIQIPEMTIVDGTTYMDGTQLAQLLTVAGADSTGVLSELLTGTYISVSSASGSGATEESFTALEDLIQSTAGKVRENVAAREDAFVENEDGSYTMTLDGVALVELIELVMNDLVAQRDSYIDAVMSVVDAEESLSSAVTREDLESLWTQMETALEEITVNEESADTLTFTSTASKSEDGSYTGSDVLTAIDTSGTRAEISLETTCTPVDNPEAITAPAESVSLEELLDSLYSFSGVTDGGTDDTSDIPASDTGDETEGELPEEDFTDDTVASGSVDDLNLTPVDDNISTITFVSAEGAQMTLPVPSSAEWDTSFISADLSSVSVDAMDGCFYGLYYSAYADSFDVEEVVDMYAELFGGDGSMQQTDVMTSSDGSVTAQAFYGSYGSVTMYDVVVSVSYGDEVAVLDITLYPEDGVDVMTEVQAMMDYLGVGAILGEGL